MMDPVAGIVAGFGLGLASTLHCAGMCGAIACALLHLGAPTTPSNAWRTAALSHAGRIVSYSLAGALVGSVGAPAMAWLDRDIAFRLAQWAAAAALMWSGLSTAGLVPPLSGLDRLFAPVANVVSRFALLAPGHSARALVGGLAWGLMPCAMVYGALLTAMLSGSALGGVIVMAAFGLGTLPGLVVAMKVFTGLRAASSRRDLRMTAGLAIAVLGFLSVWIPHGGSDALCRPGATTLTQINVAGPSPR